MAAHFDTEYQRLEASYSDSPTGEENLLVHVPDGNKSPWHHIENLDLFFQRISFYPSVSLYSRIIHYYNYPRGYFKTRRVNTFQEKNTIWCVRAGLE
ncbi:unnamed protein product [Oncorhynchus mykiss]|uniref:Uncharacterized protein n=1 Tax=Oncorhynchus mykiss TaxID=8022 RepID=A0A060YNK8_ONCMY|nr:unnamed protein product [Oncorhynchus mykiss]